MSPPKPSCFSFTRCEIIFSRPSKAPPQMNRMLLVSIGIISWLGCLRPPFGGMFATVPSIILSSAGDVARYRGRLGFARDFVYFVYVYNSALRGLNVEIGRLEQAEQNVLDVFADVARLRKRGRVGHGERDVQHLRKRLREQDVVLRKLHIVVVRGRVQQPLVMVVDRDGKDLLRLRLPYDVLVEEFLYLDWFGQFFHRRKRDIIVLFGLPASFCGNIRLRAVAPQHYAAYMHAV